MNVKIFLYAIVLMTSIFAVSGLNINFIFKKNHIWEAKIFIIMLIFSISYLVTNFLYDIINLIEI